MAKAKKAKAKKAKAKKAKAKKAEVKEEDKIFGVILTYGYVESTLPGVDAWFAGGGYYINAWEALRSLSQTFYEFYKIDEIDRNLVGRQRDCCKIFEGRRVGEFISDQTRVAYQKGKHDPEEYLQHCLACGARLIVDEGFSFEHYQGWCYEQFRLQAHEQPHFEDAWDYWRRDMGYLFDKDFREKWHWVNVPDQAELTLALALPPEEIPEPCRKTFAADFKAYFDRLDDEIQIAHSDWEEGEHQKAEAAQKAEAVQT